jgi:glycosyltransferase involved in cell wall biosynthesis
MIRTPGWIHEMDAFKPEALCLSQGSAYECVGRRSTRPLLAWLEARRPRLVNIVQFNEPRRDLRASTVSRATRLNALARVNAYVATRNIAEAANALGAPVPRARTVRNPVNVLDTTPLPWPTDTSETLRFACVARLHIDAKGQDLLLEALAARPWREAQWSISFFGEGEDASFLQARARELGLSEHVRFRGMARDIRALWRDHHMLVLSSRAEGTPLAMVEAMLLARPCLVTDVGGCADWIRETSAGANGFLAPEPSVPALGDALDRAWAARGNWAALGLAARETAAQLHDPSPGTTILTMLEGP